MIKLNIFTLSTIFIKVNYLIVFLSTLTDKDPNCNLLEVELTLRGEGGHTLMGSL